MPVPHSTSIASVRSTISSLEHSNQARAKTSPILNGASGKGKGGFGNHSKATKKYNGSLTRSSNMEKGKG